LIRNQSILPVNKNRQKYFPRHGPANRVIFRDNGPTARHVFTIELSVFKILFDCQLPPRVAASALYLFVFRIFADDPDFSVPFDDLAFVAHGFD